MSSDQRTFWEKLGLGNEKVEAERHLFVNDSARNSSYKFKNNYVETTKYNPVTFFPRALYEQFSRLGNVYFLLVSILSTTELSPVAPLTTVLPLMLVLGISLMKEGIEDTRRYNGDKAVNQSEALVFRGDKFKKVQWQTIKVGEIVKVTRDSGFPADLLCIWSSNAEHQCFVETMNLDGETNLKMKSVVANLEGLSENEAVHISGEIECDPPNNSIYAYTGNLRMEDGSLQPLEFRNLLLRGSNLRNTEAILGVVVYAGRHTKVMMNSTRPPTKRSSLERGIDQIIIGMFTLLFTMATIGSFYTAAWSSMYMNRMAYLMPWDNENYYEHDKFVLVGMAHLVTAFILYGFLIPISLYVSIEIVKVVQVYYIQCDYDMYDEPTNTPMDARTSNLNEELGQIHTILSDKTGTLTQNRMELFKATIAGVSYGRGLTEVERHAARKAGAEVPTISKPHIEGYNISDERLVFGEWQREPNHKEIREFLAALAVCHTVIPEAKEGGEEPTEATVTYMAESPDELAFIVMARELGMFVYKRTAKYIYVREENRRGEHTDHKYEVLAVLEFNATRKRMSVIYREEGGPVKMFCKGADSVIMERLSMRKNDNRFTPLTVDHTNEYARCGLRTLFFTKKEIDQATFPAWEAEYEEARRSLFDRASKLEAAAVKLEKDLILLGATAIEDKLQEGVPEAIAQLQLAGLKIWMLTGDKLETAVNIAHACSLLHDGMHEYVISLPPSNEKKVENETALVRKMLESHKIAQEMLSPRDSSGVIIDGHALSLVINNGMADLFVDLAVASAAVVCCRMSPLQKAEVVALVKHRGAKTLAIGDGANDVGMIQVADVGVGISGLEGQQAVMASDFSIAQFRFLDRLLLHHGRLSYKRFARLVSFFFYKNLIIGLILFYYDALSFFSGQTMFYEAHLGLYNVLFVAAPILVVGVFDQDVRPETARKYPQIYQQGVRNEYFDTRAKLTQIVEAVYASIVMFTLTLFAYDGKASDRNSGKVQEMITTGTVLFTVVVLVVNIQSGLLINYWNKWNHIAVWSTISVWFFMNFTWQLTPIEWSNKVHAMYSDIVISGYYLFTVLVITVATLAPGIVYRTYMRIYHPQDHEILQALEKGEQYMGASWRSYFFGENAEDAGTAPMKPIVVKKKKEKKKREKGRKEEMEKLVVQKPEYTEPEPVNIVSTDADSGGSTESGGGGLPCALVVAIAASILILSISPFLA